MTPDVRRILLHVAHSRGDLPDHAIGPVRRLLLAEMDAAVLRDRSILADRKRRAAAVDSAAAIARRFLLEYRPKGTP